MFQTARFLVFGAGTSIFPAALLLVLLFGTMTKTRKFIKNIAKDTPDDVSMYIFDSLGESMFYLTEVLPILG